MSLDFKNIGKYEEVPITIKDKQILAKPREADWTIKKYTTFKDDDEEEKTYYHFLQMHFHAPSEHTIDGVNYDAELHFVHYKDD